MATSSARVARLLGFNGGYVDTAGFLALKGLFTAHVTGNFVTLGAALVHGSTGAISKLLALPVFCVMVIAIRLLGVGLARRDAPVMRVLLSLKALLLATGGAMAIAWGPFDDADTGRAILTGMVLVAAMAIQNAAHRVHLTSEPPSTLMTGTTTQVMLDIADLMRTLPDTERAAARGRVGRMAPVLISFALGCGIAALLYVVVGLWCFALPPLTALLAVCLHREVPAVA
ncbi:MULTISPECIES: YoaK family protein [unclassified Achromobacter]|uniref:YoaK family protein n=1 Tax=unclassified Achromobacter TaxID=2626865 RepID=UPI000B51D87C|nr:MULTISPECIES: YoaK family protein [unclassified Achromobacter]OWT74303.1 hypothetical protein CEY05_16835 [Achromobacter sp. HZ34]OWT78770.1 hypothetical protein CEY04_06755 [Achromobacter sp. HZ28]